MIAALVLATAAGCAAGHRRPDLSGASAAMGPAKNGEVMGPPAESYGPLSDGAVAHYGPQPVDVKPLVIVFGPGLAPGFADAGVLRVLSKNHIPLAAVVAAETGSLIGSLYAMEDNINRFEFSLLRFREEIFVRKKGIFSDLLSASSQARSFEAELSRVFGARDVADFKIPVWIAIQTDTSPSTQFIEKGKAASALRVAMADVRLFPPAEWGKTRAQSASSSLKDLVQEARELNRGPIVVVDVSGGKELASDSGDLLISPDVSSIGLLDFNKMSEAAFQGKSAAEAKLADLQKLAGIFPGAAP